MLKRVFIAAALFIAATSSTLSAEIICEHSALQDGIKKCRSILIKGQIANGDSAKFARLLRENHPFVETVKLWSPGGLVEEGLAIGRLIRKTLLTTDAPFRIVNYPNRGRLLRSNARIICDGEGCICASACFLIWLGGIERSGEVVGIHRPSIRSTRFSDLPPDQASIQYRGLLQNVRQYMIDMETPERFIEKMIDTSSSDIRWINGDEADSMRRPPSIAEWLSASCGAMSETEIKLWAGLGLEQAKLSVSQRTTYTKLDERRRSIWICESEKLEQNRVRVSFP